MPNIPSVQQQAAVFPEDSQNSLPSSERETDNGEANMSFGDHDDHCSVVISES